MADKTERARLIVTKIAEAMEHPEYFGSLLLLDGELEAVLALAAELAAAEKERNRLREEVRIREQSQIPVIPREAVARLKALEKRNGELAAALRLAYPYVKDQAQEGSKALRDLVRADLDVIGPLLAASGVGEETT